MNFKKLIENIKNKDMDIKNTYSFENPILFDDELTDSYYLILRILKKGMEMDKTEEMNKEYLYSYTKEYNLYIHDNGYIENISKKDYIYKSFLDIQNKILNYISGIKTISNKMGMDTTDFIRYSLGKSIFIEFHPNEDEIPTEKINFLFDYED